MLSNETISLIHLNMIQGVGLKTVQRLRDVFGSAAHALQATPNELEKVDQLSPAMQDLLKRKPIQYPIRTRIGINTRIRLSGSDAL